MSARRCQASESRALLSVEGKRTGYRTAPLETVVPAIDAVAPGMHQLGFAPLSGRARPPLWRPRAAATCVHARFTRLLIKFREELLLENSFCLPRVVLSDAVGLAYASSRFIRCSVAREACAPSFFNGCAIPQRSISSWPVVRK